MFFFFYGELGELEYNAIVKSAFEKMMFEKLQSEGYCDINPLIGRPRTSKSEIENNLKRLDSPLAKVFAGKYATNTKELETIMLPVLKELEEKTSKNKCCHASGKNCRWQVLQVRVLNNYIWEIIGEDHEQRDGYGGGFRRKTLWPG